MLVLTRRAGESIVIGNDITVTVLEVRGDQVRIGVDAPRTVAVHREEVYAQVQQENRGAVAAAARTADLLRRSGRPPGARAGSERPVEACGWWRADHAVDGGPDRAAAETAERSSDGVELGCGLDGGRAGQRDQFGDVVLQAHLQVAELDGLWRRPRARMSSVRVSSSSVPSSSASAATSVARRSSVVGEGVDGVVHLVGRPRQEPSLVAVQEEQGQRRVVTDPVEVDALVLEDAEQGLHHATTTDRGSIGVPSRRTSKCRCGPVDIPVEPTVPSC